MRDMIIAQPMRYPFKAIIAKTKVIMPVMRTYVLFHACAISPDGRTIVAGEALGSVHFLRLMGA